MSPAQQPADEQALPRTPHPVVPDEPEVPLSVEVLEVVMPPDELDATPALPVVVPPNVPTWLVETPVLEVLAEIPDGLDPEAFDAVPRDGPVPVPVEGDELPEVPVVTAPNCSWQI